VISKKSERIAITWQGNLVGWMENCSIENWFHDGTWISADTEATNRFLQAILEKGEALVLLGEMKGRVEELPVENSICVKIWPGLDW
jgi:hypothetical protein